jgi:hypothetical protein
MQGFSFGGDNLHIVRRFETESATIQVRDGLREGWLSPVEGTRLESEKASSSEVCKVLHILAKLAPSKSLAADLAFQIVFLFCVNCSCGLVLTVETDRINFSSRFVAFDFLGRALNRYGD